MQTVDAIAFTMLAVGFLATYLFVFNLGRFCAISRVNNKLRKIDESNQTPNGICEACGIDYSDCQCPGQIGRAYIEFPGGSYLVHALMLDSTQIERIKESLKSLRLKTHELVAPEYKTKPMLELISLIEKEIDQER
jgi:hypothetical protein